MGTIKRFAVSRPWVTAFIVLVVALGGWRYYSKTHNQPVVDFATVTRGTVSQVVSVTGKVKPASEVKLSFEKGGRIAVVYHDVGERVYAGAYLVSLENADTAAQLSQAKATVRAQEAKLAELKKGARPEDILVSEVDVSNATNDVVNDIKNAYVNSDDAIRNKVDQLFSNPRSSYPQFNFVISNSQIKSDIETGRPIMETTLAVWGVSIADVSLSQTPDRFISDAKVNLRAVQNYLDKVAMAVNSLTPSSTVSQTTIDGYKAAILSGRTNATNALDTLTAAEEKLRTAQSKLALKKAGTVQEQIDAQSAEVDASQANVLNLQAQLAKTVIRSPIAGIVTRQDAKEGEIAVAGAALVSVISDAKYEIEANVPEADIAKIKIGDSAEVTLDAYGNDVIFVAVVAKMDPAETVIDGVATYKTTLQFRENDPRIRPGMTANTDIRGEKRENVLYIPGRVISTKEGVKTVKLIDGKEVRDTTITTGLRGSDGDVEVLTGLKEGDKLKLN